jgi:hypothetical protein
MRFDASAPNVWPIAPVQLFASGGFRYEAPRARRSANISGEIYAGGRKFWWFINACASAEFGSLASL